MPRAVRVVVPGAPHQMTQRGTHRENVFSLVQDRRVYLELLREQCEKAELLVVGLCLMSNRVHLVVTPEHEAAMAQATGRAHFRYANYYLARRRRSGHLWQNRFCSCPLSESHLVTAMLYLEQNPVRAGMVAGAADWRWSSAREETRRLEQCTYAGKPYGEESFVVELSGKFGRCLALRGPGRPPRTKHAGVGS